MVRKAKGLAAVAEDAAPAGVAEGAAPVDERSPLIARSASPSYSAVPRGEDVDARLESNKHFNLAGLGERTFWVLMSALYVCSFLVAFDGLVVATLLGSISSSFQATNLASWLGTSYMLSVCCFTPIYGRLCNIIGRQASMLIALAIFGTGNLLCAIAPSMHFLILARAIAGMGGGGMSTVGSTITSDLVPIHLRGIFQGLGNVAFGLGTGLGAPIGGIMNDYLGWRWAFGFQIPIFIIAGLAVWFNVRYTVPSNPASGSATPVAKQTPFQLIKRIDWVGTILLAAWVGAALVAVSLNTNSTTVDAYPWTSPTILGLFGASAVLFVVFLFVELKWAAEPVMPFELLHRRTPMAVALNNFILSVSLFGCMYSVPLYYTAVRQMSASFAGAHLIPNAVCSMVGSLASGVYVRQTGKYYWLNFWSGVVGIVSAWLMYTWDVDTPSWQLWVGFVPMSFSLGAVTTLTIVGLVADVGRDHIAVATSLSYVSRTLGQVLGVALSGALLQVVLQRELSARITGEGAKELIAAIRESSSSIRTLPPHLKASAIISYQKGLQAVFFAAIFLNIAETLVGLGMRNVDLKPTSTKKTDEEEGDDE